MDDDQTVKIQYSVKLGELWREPKRLLEQTFEHIDELPAQKWTADESILSNSTVDKIHSLRVKLEAADRMLRDISGIVEQYLEFRNSPPPPAPEIEVQKANVPAAEGRAMIPSPLTNLLEAQRMTAKALKAMPTPNEIAD